MSRISILIQLLILLLVVSSQGQNNIKNVLASIEKNNKTLVSQRQYWEAKKLEYKTGLTLPNPTVQGQYLLGSPATAGNQTDFFAVQPFDFPGTYKKRRQLAETQAAQSTAGLAATRQQVLLEAKLSCVELVYRNKLRAHLSRRQVALERIGRDFQTKLDQGEGNILNVNKVKLQLLELSQLIKENETAQQGLLNHLRALNGGLAIVFTDTIYPLAPSNLSFEQIEQENEAADPLLKTLEQEQVIAEKQVELSKIWRLPKFELGYHYQSILGQRFNGIHTGLTLPLWEHKYRREQQQALLQFTNLQVQDHRNEHFYTIKKLYDQQAALKTGLEQYTSVLSGIQSIPLLDKALAMGEITTVEYFLEVSLYQNALLYFLRTEWEYQGLMVQLFKYQL
ncbi:MAG: TolC family protein [Haliscomenobacter sp.]|uniref:TolC family protein n=1 Tax=Haliscomenobacter sp. TaxID=2717303 RepID=UPI0029B560D2|nr:TolC family protein [Haliscomenobacter sp.]MDX2067788.1 TolC family protein [Haliscomenobacter sp.]